MFVTQLTCWHTGKPYDHTVAQNLSDDGRPLRVDYDLERVGAVVTREQMAARDPGVWAWRELLPLPAAGDPVTLGEGGTPLLPNDTLRRELDVADLLIKDEGVNPGGSFKARGMTGAVTMAKHFGAKALAVPSAGNAGGALAMYAAAAGLQAHIFMPKDVPMANRLECELAGAKVTLVDGLINDCGAKVRAGCDKHGWFDVSTLKEPYRVEGKKTMGLELACQLGWRLPDVILYPTGGGTGLVGMAKAFEELRQLGWIRDPDPRFVSVQAEGCCPIVRAFEAGAKDAPLFENASTYAAGLRVPKAVGDFIMLDILRESEGTAIAVSDEEMMPAARQMTAASGVCAAPEGGAVLAAARRLRESGFIKANDQVVLFNTGTGLKYAEAFAAID